MRGAESGSQLEWAWTHREWPVNIDARGSVRQRAAREPPDDHIARQLCDKTCAQTPAGKRNSEMGIAPAS